MFSAAHSSSPKLLVLCAAAITLLVVTACSGEESEPAPDPANAADMSVGSADMSAPAEDMTGVVTPDGGPVVTPDQGAADMSDDMTPIVTEPDMDPGMDMADMDPAMDMGEMPVDMNGVGEEEQPPIGHDAISMYLQEKRYSNFAVEPSIHQSSGPHGGRVLTFVNAPLERSLRDGDATHPVGSASIKELYRSSDEVQGWAVSIKVADEGTAQDWYWYYLLSTASGAAASADGRGVPLCANCHSGGTDYLLTFGPFERN